VGKGINKDNLEEYATFLCGPCSCEAKSQNPGLDLLFAADWYAPLRDMPQVTAGLPDVIGSPTAGQAGAAAPSNNDGNEEEEFVSDDPFCLRQTMISVALVFVVGGALGVWVSFRPKRASKR